MAKSIFVSYNFNDRRVEQAVKNMMLEHKNDIDGEVVFVENDVSYNGNTAINWEIEHTMDKCDAALFVVGREDHNSPWLEKEANRAQLMHIPMLATCLPGEEIADNTQGLVKNNCVLLGWDSQELCTKLNQC